MAKLTWDETGTRYYETGVKKGVLYLLSVAGTYTPGVAWNGLTNVDSSPDGADVTDLYADDIKYGSIRATENYGGTINAYTYPDEFTACDGSASPVDGVYLGQQSRKTFGLCYRTAIGSDADSEMSAYKLHLIWNATASPSDKTYETINDSPDAGEFSWEFDTNPIAVSASGQSLKPTSHITIDSRYADATKLAALETKLYGSDDAEPILPLPTEVISIMAAG